MADNKYHAKPSGGRASRKEYYRAVQLQLLERRGIISDLREQVRYEIVPAQRGADGRLLERAVCYVADFVYTNVATGEQVVEDTKGYRTQEYIIKRKLMLLRYGIKISEI